MQFNKKCKVLHMARNNPRHQDILGYTKLENSLSKKDLRSPGGYQVEREPVGCLC